MTQRTTIRRHVDGPVAQVLDRLGDPEVARRRAESVPGLPGRVVALETGDSQAGEAAVDLLIRAELPTDWVPAQVRGRLSGVPAVARREVWRSTASDAAEAVVEVVLESLPATTLEASGTLRPDGAGSLLEYHLALTVSVPVIGPLVERAVLDRLSTAYAMECDVIAHACT